MKETIDYFGYQDKHGILYPSLPTESVGNQSKTLFTVTTLHDEIFYRCRKFDNSEVAKKHSQVDFYIPHPETAVTPSLLKMFHYRTCEGKSYNSIVILNDSILDNYSTSQSGDLSPLDNYVNDYEELIRSGFSERRFNFMVANSSINDWILVKGESETVGRYVYSRPEKEHLLSPRESEVVGLINQRIIDDGLEDKIHFRIGSDLNNSSYTINVVLDNEEDSDYVSEMRYFVSLYNYWNYCLINGKGIKHVYGSK